MAIPIVRLPLVAALFATLALGRPAPAAAQFAVQGAGIFAALDGGSFTTGLSGPGVEGTVLFHTFLFEITGGAQFIDYGSVNVFGLVFEPRLLLPDTERIKPYVGLRGIAAKFSYPHELGDAKGTGSQFSIGFGVRLGLSRRVDFDAAYHYLLSARFGTSRVDGTAVDNSPITGHGGGLQLRMAVSVKLGKR
jgi:hypothetical protein